MLSAAFNATVASLPADFIINSIGIAVFAVTGVLAGAKKGMDLFGIVVLALITAFGGGTIRDIILDAPVFWVENFSYVYIAIIAAIAAFYLQEQFWKTYKPLLHFDALGVALFNVEAIDKTLALGYGAEVAVTMGLITGIAGSIIRDVLADRPNLLLKKEMYATPIFTGGIVYVTLLCFVPQLGLINAGIGILTVFVIRVAAIRWNITYPKFMQIPE